MEVVMSIDILIEDIKESGLFDTEWYLKEYPDVDMSGLQPIDHYMLIGWRIGRSPSPKFCATQYLEYHHDVNQANVNPLLHYIKTGKGEGRIVFPIKSRENKLDAKQAPEIIPELDPITKLMLWNESGNKNSEEYKDTFDRVKGIQAKKSEDAVTKDVKTVPNDWPDDLILRPLPESTNDYEWAKQYRKTKKPDCIGLSVIIPTFNRSHILSVTLAALTHQKTDYSFEVVVADDGSQEDITSVVRDFESLLDIKYVRQKDAGYRLSAVRNLGIRTARYEFVSILDCDMAPADSWVQTNVDVLLESDEVAVVGPRKYVDTSRLSIESCLNDNKFLDALPEVRTNNSVAGKDAGEISVDWRLKTFEETDNLRLSDAPFRFFSGGNVAFSKKWMDKAGWFDEEFEAWGGEDGEYGYRLYRAGCFFQSHMGALAYHQEPPGKENETDRAAGKAITEKLRSGKVPYFYRKATKIESVELNPVPLVSVYIPAYNCQDSIVRCVDSALNQTIADLEVCICDDGSTDSTLEVIKSRYGDNPRVRFISQENGGIGSASNAAVRLCRGYYIAQLDSDDYLNPDAVEICLSEFLKDHSLACVYTTNNNVNPDGSLIAPGYNWPVYSREKFTTAMIVHHFRMFTARAWNLSGGFDESITNAVDYDMYLKLSELGPFKHVNKVCYNRVIHGDNTSVKQLGKQKLNHFKVVQSSLARQKASDWEYTALTPEDACRKYFFRRAT
jgi:chondroitin synthase